MIRRAGGGVERIKQQELVGYNGKQLNWVDDNGNEATRLGRRRWELPRVYGAQGQQTTKVNEGQIQEWVVDDDRQERFEIGR